MKARMVLVSFVFTVALQVSATLVLVKDSSSDNVARTTALMEAYAHGKAKMVYTPLINSGMPQSQASSCRARFC